MTSKSSARMQARHCEARKLWTVVDRRRCRIRRPSRTSFPSGWWTENGKLNGNPYGTFMNRRFPSASGATEEGLADTCGSAAMLNSEGTIQRKSAFQGPENVLTVPEVNREPRGTHAEGSMPLRAEHTWGLKKKITVCGWLMLDSCRRIRSLSGFALGFFF